MNILRRTALILPPYLWLLMLFLIPFAIVFKISLSDYALAIPRYMPQYSPDTGVGDLISKLDGENYQFILGDHLYNIWASITNTLFGTEKELVYADDLYWKAYVSSLKIALFSTGLTLAVGFPFAWAMARSPEAYRPMLMMLVILPFWTSFLIRVYAWRGILSQTGYLNQILMALGIIDEPLIILNTNVAVYIGIVYTYLPFMVLPIYATLEKLDESLNEAAIDLGCTRTSAFWLVTLPLARPGIIAGCFLVFIPALGEYVIPELLGGSDTLMIGKVLVEEFEKNGDWPSASAGAVILLLIRSIPIVLFQRNQQKNQEAGL